MTITGTLKVKNDTVQVSEKFAKRDFVLTDGAGMYPQDILFQVSQDKVSLLDPINVGQMIEVCFNIRGREWTNPQGEVKYFNTLDAWKVTSLSNAPNAMKPNVEFSNEPPSGPVVNPADVVEDPDLPF